MNMVSDLDCGCYNRASGGLPLDEKAVGAYKHKKEMKESIGLLHKMGYKLYGSKGTSDYFNHEFENKDLVEVVDWKYENIGEDHEIDTMAENVVSMADYLSKKHFDLVINLPMRTGGEYVRCTSHQNIVKLIYKCVHSVESTEFFLLHFIYKSSVKAMPLLSITS